VQVGGQAHADRYTYLPFIGIFINISSGDLMKFQRKILIRNKMVMKIVIAILFLVLLLNVGTSRKLEKQLNAFLPCH